jgi:hypothetical protein
MKHLSFFMLLFLILPFIACQDENNVVTTNLDLVVDVPLQASLLENQYIVKSSPIDQYAFSGDATFCLAAHGGFKNCPAAVLGVTPGTGALLSFEGLGDYNEIESLTLEWGYTPAGSIDFHIQTPIELLAAGERLTHVHFAVDLDEILQPVIQQMNVNPRNLIYFHIKGVSNFNTSMSAALKVPVVVESDLSSPRFTVW